MAIAIDASTPAIVSNTGSTKTTASFTAPANSLLVACVGMEDEITVTMSNSGTALTWTSRKFESGSSGGYVVIFTAPAPTSAARTVTASGSSAGALKVFVVTGADLTSPVGASGSNVSSTNNITPAVYTSTVAGSRAIGIANDWSVTGTPTSSDTGFAYLVASQTCGIAVHKATNTTSASTSVTLNFDASGTAPTTWAWAAVEIKPSTSTSATIDATVVTATADIPTPGIRTGQTVHATAVDAVADIPAPGVHAGQTVHPDTVDAVAVIPTPSVTAGSAELVEPVTVTATAVIPTPSVTAISNATPSPATVTATADIPTPTITAIRQAVITPTTVDALADIPTPGIQVPILPGQFITGDFQIEWASQLYGGYGNVYQVIAGSVEGWDDLPGLDSDSALRPSRHGAWPGKSLAQQREVSAIIAVDDPVTFIASMRALRRATAVTEDDSEYTLAIRTYGEALLAYGAVSARAIPMDHYGQGWAEVSLRWICSDPRRFDLTQQSVVVAADGSATLTNDGDTATSPRFRIQGPATNPALINETLDRILAFNIVLTGGQLLEIDTQLGTVMIGDTSYMSTLASESVPPEDFVLAPSDNLITYETDSGGTAGAETIWRAAYL